MKYKKKTLPSKNKQEYYNYLRSQPWRDKRKLALEFYGNNCCLCGSRHSIQVHHRNYRNIFHENMEDLILLCESCHKQFHKNKIWKNGKTSKYMKHPESDVNTVTYYPNRKRFEDALFRKFMFENKNL